LDLHSLLKSGRSAVRPRPWPPHRNLALDRWPAQKRL